MLAAVSALALLASSAAEVLSLDPSATTVSFHVNHKMHRVDGSSRSAEGKAVIEPDGKVLAMVRVPVASFESGDANRDSHMRETLGVGHHPFVVFKGVSSLDAPLDGRPVSPRLKGELDFHGVKRRVEVPVSVQPGGDGSVRVRGSLRISLEEYGIDRPSLLFVKIDDQCTIEFDLLMRRAP